MTPDERLMAIHFLVTEVPEHTGNGSAVTRIGNAGACLCPTRYTRAIPINQTPTSRSRRRIRRVAIVCATEHHWTAPCGVPEADSQPPSCSPSSPLQVQDQLLGFERLQ